MYKPQARPLGARLIDETHRLLMRRRNGSLAGPLSYCSCNLASAVGTGVDVDEAWRAKRGRFGIELGLAKGSALRRALFFAAGLVALGLGGLGVVLPVLPTTPFMILAAACFARSSGRFYNAVMSDRLFGPLVFRWQQTRTMPNHVKLIAIALIVLTIGSSVAFFVPFVWAKVVVALIGVALVTWLVRIPSRVMVASHDA